MTLRRMWDAAFPPEQPPSWEAVAGYIGGNTPHVWTAAEWDRQPARWRLPIFTRSHDGDPGADAAFCVSWLASHGVPRGVTLALDFETRVDPAYLAAFDAAVQAGGWLVMVYGSLSTVTSNPKPSGGYWVAHWTNVPHLEPGSAATQYGGDVTIGQPYDANLLADTTPLWDTRPEDDMPLTEDDAALVARKWHEMYGIRLAQWIAGKSNTVYNTTSIGADAPSSAADAAAVLADAAAVLADLAIIKAALEAGVPVALTQDQLDQVTAALQRLEGSALVQLAVSPAP